MTDSGNGAWLASIREHKLRWVPELKKWARYRQGVWTFAKVNDEHEVGKALNIMRDAASEYGGPDADAFRGWAERSRSGRARRDMLASAKEHLGKFEHFFDANPLLFNCANGTLDLTDTEKVEIHPHRYTDFITLKSPVAYDAEATCPQFEAWLMACVNNSPALFGYMQEVMGSCLEGRSGLRRFYFIFGPKGTGKSTFLRTLNKLLGDYQCSVSFKTLSESKWAGDGSAPSEDVARLRGRRLVSATEAKDSHTLDSARIKQLIGGDKIVARSLRQESREFAFEATLIMAGNEMPRIFGDESIWEKFKPVPFEHSIEREDPDYEATHLDPELSGILNFAIRGLARLRKAGYRIEDPPEVEAARETEQEAQDPFRDFAAEHLDFEDSQARTESATVYDAYVSWCVKKKQYAQKRNKLTRWLSKKRNVTQTHSNVKDYYCGVKMRYVASNEGQTPF